MSAGWGGGGIVVCLAIKHEITMFYTEDKNGKKFSPLKVRCVEGRKELDLVYDLLYQSVTGGGRGVARKNVKKK